MHRLFLVAGAAAVVAVLAFAAHDDAFDFPYIPLDHAAIDYDKRPLDDAISRLQERLDKGEVKLAYEANHGGYLGSLLKALQVNVDSQLLVFSKTSFQATKISPKAPRALYFNDDVEVGFVHGGDVMEFIAFDRKQGVNFYTLDVEKEARPSFVHRNEECLACHLIPGTLNVPGLVISSVIPTPQGSPRFPGAGVIVDSRTPIGDRWGGWYVTGNTGTLLHRGNAVAPYPDRPDMLDLHNTQNLTSLNGRFDSAGYLAPGSDIVALMTLEHQTRMTNLITRIAWEIRAGEESGEKSQERLDFVTKEFVSYMLFAGEAKIYEPIEGVSTFTKTFAERGPHDRQGRSLRDFDLHKRLFRYPLSYMIYSPAFDSLPNIAKERIYRRLYEVLAGNDQSKAFDFVTAEDRRAILEILRDTKPDLPAYWKTAACCN
jgi:hypothetical protein